MKHRIVYGAVVIGVVSVFGVLVCGMWARYAAKRVAIVNTPIVSGQANGLALVDQPTSANKNPLISPDGKWLLDVRKVGDVPLARFVEYYLVLRNLKGGQDEYRYLDWFERAGDAPAGPSPLGWSKDGGRIYLFYPRDPNAYSTYAKIAQRGGSVVAIGGGETPIEPYHETFPRPQDTYGLIVDADPVLEKAVWLEQPMKSGPSRLLLFSMNPTEDSAVKTVYEFSAEKGMTIASVSIDVDGEGVAYVVRENGHDDQVYLYDAKTGENIAIPYDVSLTRKLGITGDFAVSVQKTAMAFNPSGLFLTVEDRRGKKIVLRRLVAAGKATWFQE